MILHLPLRSFGQFRSRLVIGLRIAKTRKSDNLETAIKEVIEPGEAKRRWDELIESAAAGLATGAVVEDTRLRDLMRTVGTPEDGTVEPAPFSATPGPGQLAADRAEVTREALAGLVHNHAQALGERDAAAAAARGARKRLTATEARLEARGEKVREAHRRSRKLAKRLKRIEDSRWWRLRPRLPRK